MPTEVRLAVAGSGKTAEIVEKIEAQPVGTASIALTFTRQAQAEIDTRIRRGLVSDHETMGWYSFLTKHIVRPYLPTLFPGTLPRGLCFVQSAKQIPRLGGWRHYFNKDFEPYSVRLPLLAKKVLQTAGDAPIKRLERIYDNLYIDEFQDLGGNDLEVLEALMESNINMLFVGDARQALLSTSSSDRLHRDYRGVKVVDWFRAQEQADRCQIVPNDTTTRFNQRIADFSDLIHDPALALPPTHSKQTQITGHDGVFLVDEEHLDEYFSIHPKPPTILWYRNSDRAIPEGEVHTFGKAKGLTRDRIIILATDPMVKLLKARMAMSSKSACGFYVAATRARYSVAIVVKRASQTHAALHPDFQGKVSLWEPDDS